MLNLPYTTQSLQCPNQAQWLRYKQGQSSAEETRAIEIHFTDCPLCSEAVETIMSTEAPILEAQWEQLLQQAPMAATPTKPQTSNFLTLYWKPLSAAAAILICFWGGYSLYQNAAKQTPQVIAQNKETIKHEPQASDSTPALVSNTELEKNTTAPIKQVAPSSATEIISKNTPAIINTNAAQSLAKEEVEMLADADHIAATPVAAAPPSALQEVGANINATTQNKLIAAKNLGEQKDLAVSKKRAYTNTESAKAHQYNSQKETFNAAANVAPAAATDQLAYKKEIADETLVNTTSGTELYLLKQYAACIPLLEKELKHATTQDQKALYLADAYQKTGNTRAARKRLQQIINQNGPYAKQAQQMLDLLNK